MLPMSEQDTEILLADEQFISRRDNLDLFRATVPVPMKLPARPLSDKNPPWFFLSKAPLAGGEPASEDE